MLCMWLDVHYLLTRIYIVIINGIENRSHTNPIKYLKLYTHKNHVINIMYLILMEHKTKK